MNKNDPNEKSIDLNLLEDVLTEVGKKIPNSPKDFRNIIINRSFIIIMGILVPVNLTLLVIAIIQSL